MEKPSLTREITEEEKARITDVKGGKKILGTARFYDGETKQGRTIYFLEGGTERIEDDKGNTAQWIEATDGE